MLVVVLGPKRLHSWSAATVVQFLRHALISPCPQFQTLNSFFVHISWQFYTAMNLDQMNQPLNFLHARSEHQQCLHQETLSSISWLVCSSWPYFHPNDPSTSTIRKFQKKWPGSVNSYFDFPTVGETDFLGIDNCWIRATCLVIYFECA